MKTLAGQILSLAWPVLGAQMAAIGMMAADTIIVGHFSTDHLAAVAVGAGIFVTIFLSLAGILQALSPIIGQHYGAKRIRAIAHTFRQGLWLALFLSLAGSALLLFPKPLLAPAQLSPEVEAIAENYLRILAFALPGGVCYRAFHATANALFHPRPLMIIGGIETAAHAGLSWLLVHGAFGLLPELGATGAALSQVVVTWFAALSGFWLLRHDKRFVPFAMFAVFEKPVWARQKEILRLGLPIGLSWLVEISSFTFMAIFIARLGADVVSGHRIAANLSALFYALPLSLAIATASVVANCVGAGKEAVAARAARTGVLVAASLALVTGFFLWRERLAIASLATDDAAVVVIGAGLAIYIAAYQFFDAIQTVCAFTLRAYKISFVPLLIHVSVFWGIGLGLGFWLAFHAPVPQGAAGFWQAAALATLVASVLFGSLLAWVIRLRRSGEHRLR